MIHTESNRNEVEALTKELEIKHGAMFSRQTAAVEMNLHPETIKRWNRIGRLPCVRLSERSVKIEARELAKLIAGCRV